jgi:hypothetical protein
LPRETTFPGFATAGGATFGVGFAAGVAAFGAGLFAGFGAGLGASFAFGAGFAAAGFFFAGGAFAPGAVGRVERFGACPFVRGRVFLDMEALTSLSKSYEAKAPQAPRRGHLTP